MNHEHAIELVERIRHHCWDVAEAAISRLPEPGSYRSTMTAITLKNSAHT